jgi:Anti-sigma factor NepR
VERQQIAESASTLSVPPSLEQKMTIRKGDAGPKPTAPGVAFDPIEAALREMHDKVADETIPDEFFSLLDELDARAAKLGKTQ